eukprot:CAMPEP_0197288364 /NCGR_PEP_ID=MMETSP0890-20130614/5405_1 /TAXON_ID=44058 ORGANISM="Aureoumbra lagunensis, Strain CCMP1510" /NCGR_SAMPLE_ID=MMETSP0890 /ASSEMBLY_ACC=CAM_ASM_000533 /LENGTH=294 /DNA_ID=CAMNT_0042759027 /DNA_START=12 /DNA_END=896 /DNA_ORIENTATION=-
MGKKVALLFLIQHLKIVIGGEECLAEDEACDYYEHASHYDKVWGSDNLHFGYFPHLDEKTSIVLDHRQAATALTEKMMALGKVGPGTTVLDLGAGKGRACLEIAQLTNASCFGLDLTPANIKRANELKSQYPELSLRFEVGSFTNLPQSVLEFAPFDIVFSQVSFCHVHLQLDTIFTQVKRVMGPTSYLLVNDYLGSEDKYSDDTKKYVFQRLHFETLYSPSQWRKTADAAGLVLQQYFTLDKHLQRAYVDMAQEARNLNISSSDGTPLAFAYEKSAHAASLRQIGMNLALYSL